jgi:poly-gamma-glutamate capsule biosynthesis protein CapA/YwtB (metallophosphatase superfamily)
MTRMSKTSSPRRMTVTIALAPLLAGLLALLPVRVVSTQQPGITPFERDLTRELANKMSGTYVVSAVGDILMQEPMGKMISPEIQRVLRDADTTVGNKEHYVIDSRNWAHGHGNNWAPKELAKDLAELGFDLLAPGEGDGGVEGMKSSAYWYDQVGIKIAGQGPNLATARMPVFQQLAKGRVALVSAFPVPDRGAGSNAIVAGNRDGNNGSDRFGLNPLRLTVWNVVTAPMLQQLKAMKEAVMARRTEPDVARPMAVTEDAPDRVTLFADQRYMAGPKPGEFHYEMNRADLEAQVLATRNAKEYADFAMFTMHVHQNRSAFQAYSQDHYPVNYLKDLAHTLVENGMDMFVGHGNHTMQGIEIYKGRPIFYNLGNFAVHRFGADDSGTGTMTDIERGESGTEWLQQYINLVAYVAVSKYQNGALEEVRIYPVDLGVDRASRPWSKMSIPMTPSPELANRILADIQKYSEPFGTKITIEKGVGIIRVPREATVPVGGNIRSTFTPTPGRGGRRGGQ